MGWGRFLLLGDLGQQFDLSDQKEEIQRLRLTLSQTRQVASDWKRDIDRLSKENDELKLYVAAISRILVSKGVITAEEVASFVDAVDSDDGRKDGRFTGRLT